MVHGVFDPQYQGYGKKTTVGRVPGYVGLPEGRARPGASRSKIVVNFYRTKSNNDDPLND